MINKKYSIVKRIIDVIIATILLILLSIPMLVVALAIKLESKGPAIFKQVRTGYKGKEFKLYKFRSMACNNDVHNFKEEDKVTKVGKFIRKTSLDELPQLINILRGEMSFIGPRPWIPEYALYFTKEQKHRLDVLPGITGLAQACGRNSIDIMEKIRLDLKYVGRYSFVGDLKVIYWTIKTVISKEGAENGKMGIKSELEQLKDNYIKCYNSKKHSNKRIQKNKKYRLKKKEIDDNPSRIGEPALVEV